MKELVDKYHPSILWNDIGWPKQSEHAMSYLMAHYYNTVANNGNLLLNISPKADGTIPEEQVRRLLVLGKWLDINGEGIHGTRCSRRIL